MRAFRAYRCNSGSSEVSRQHLLTAEDWAAAGEDPPERDGPVVWGVDIGGSRSGTAVVACWLGSGRAEALLALPEQPGLEDREKLDQVPPELYRAAVEDGDLIVRGRRAPDVRAIVAGAARRFGKPVAVACDAWKVDQLQDALEECDLRPELALRRQGWHHAGQDAESLRAILGERFRPVRSGVWDWSLSRAILRADPAGNVRIERRRCDDLAVASSLAAGVVERDGERLLKPKGRPSW